MLPIRSLLFVATLLLALGGAQASAQAAQAGGDARSKAIEQVLLSSRSGDPFLRANAIEAITPVPDRARPLAQLGLKDEHPAVRFAAAVTIGKLRLSGMQGAMGEAMKDADPSVRAAALYAATRLGMKVNISELAGAMSSRDVGVRSNAAMLLALMEDEGAVPMMKELGQMPLSRRTPSARQAVYRVQLAEALVELGDEEALESIRAGAFSSFDEVRVVSVQAMGRLQDQRMIPALQRIQLNAPVQVQLAAAQALAQMNGAVDTAMVLNAASYTPEQVLTQARTMQRQGMDQGDHAYISRLLEDPGMRTMAAAAIRAEAAFVLGFIGEPAARAKLEALLSDPVEQVRLSAAAALLRGGGSGPLARP